MIEPEPVMPDAPDRVGRVMMTQSWLDLTFLHWEVEAAAVAALLPAGTVPDLHDGVCYVGLVPFRMHRVGWFGLPGLPYVGSFPETNVRLYAVDGRGRRGVVFRSLDASRLLPVLGGRLGFGLPYVWAGMAVRRDGDTIRYAGRRRWPGRGPASRIEVRVGDPLADPSDLEHFLTARWGLFTTLAGRTAYLPNHHPRWPLYRAELLRCDQDLLAAAGLPAPPGPPVSVLYSPGVPVRFGLPDLRTTG